MNLVCRNILQNKCRPPAAAAVEIRQQPTTQSLESRYEHHRRVGIVWAKTLLLGDRDQPLLDDAAHVVVTNHVNGDASSAYIQTSARYPEPSGVVYLPLPHPRDNIDYNVTLDARDKDGRYCQSYCLNDNDGQFDRYEASSKQPNFEAKKTFMMIACRCAKLV